MLTAIPVSYARPPLRRFTGLLLCLIIAGLAAFGFGARDARADTLPDKMNYSGAGSYTRSFFDETFQANLPDMLPDRYDGRLKVRIALETTTRAKLRPRANLYVDQLSAQRGGTLSVSSSLQSYDAAGSDIADAELVVEAEPALHIIADVEPDNTDPFECAFPGMTSAATFDKNTPIPASNSMTRTGDGDATCVKTRITASMLPGLDLPDVFVLIQENLAMPYGGSRAFHRDQELFQIKVCKMLSHTFPALSFLGDHCRIRVVGTADAELLLDGVSEGFRSSAELQIRTVTTSGTASNVTLPAQAVHFASASPRTRSFSIPCNALAGSQVAYRLKNNLYSGRVRNVELGVKLVFNVDVAGDVFTIDLGQIFGRLDLLEGRAISVGATSPAVSVPLGYMTTNRASSCNTGAPVLMTSFNGHAPVLFRGETQFWSLSVLNAGTGNTNGGSYTLTVTLPSPYNSVTVQPSQDVSPGSGGWSCSQSGTGGRTITCTRSKVLEGATQAPSIRISAKFPSTSCGITVTANASISGGGSATDTAGDGGTQLSCSSNPDGSTDPKCVPTASDPCDDF